MRPLALLLCVLGCAEWRMPPTFPERAAGRPVVHEQALLGLSPLRHWREALEDYMQRAGYAAGATAGGS